MIQAKFSVLGIENSGKTTYISKIKGFDLHSNRLSIIEADNSCDTGQTSIEDYYRYQFNLNYNSECLIKFQLNDYCGKLLKLKEANSVQFEKLLDDTYLADFIIIFIDGAFFSDRDKDAVLKNVKRKCARIINPYISTYSEKNNGFIPPILIAITKSSMFTGIYSNQEILDFITEAFSSIFSEEINHYVICIDGDAEIAVKIPILIGLDYVLSCECEKIRLAVEEQNARIQDKIADYENFLRIQNDRLILKSRKKINDAEHEITRLKEKIQANTNALNKNVIWYQRDMLRSILVKELKLNREALIFGFDTALNYPDNIESNSHGIAINILKKAIVLVALFIIGNFMPVIYSLGTLVATFLYGKKSSFIMTIILLIMNFFIEDKFLWVDELLQIVMIIFFAYKAIKNKK